MSLFEFIRQINREQRDAGEPAPAASRKPTPTDTGKAAAAKASTEPKPGTLTNDQLNGIYAAHRKDTPPAAPRAKVKAIVAELEGLGIRHIVARRAAELEVGGEPRKVAIAAAVHETRHLLSPAAALMAARREVADGAPPVVQSDTAPKPKPASTTKRSAAEIERVFLSRKVHPKIASIAAELEAAGHPRVVALRAAVYRKNGLGATDAVRAAQMEHAAGESPVAK